MPAVAAPYGLLPVGLIGGQAYVGSTRMIPIASAYGTSIFFGDVVKLASDGTLQKDTGTATATPVGVFLGCSYTDATFGKVFRQYFPASTVATDIQAYVCDDPDVLFKVAVCSATTTIGSVTRANVGENAPLIQNTGSTVTGDSKVAANSAALATTNTLPLRIVDVVPETAINSTAYSEVIVKWNAGMHQYLNATGV
jgi:hypothetical protein